MKKKITFIGILLLLIIGQTNAQEREITGKITSSEDRLGIPGASVVIEGTTIGVVTDIDGNYSLRIPATATRLKVSALGMRTAFITLGAANSYDVVMDPDVLKLDEVVVTALGISREKKALGYSTQTVGGEAINNLGQGNLINEMQGKVSGLTVINSGGDPGAGTYIRLRGVTSLTGNNQPLMVVDGIPIDNSINAYDPTNAGFQAGGAAGNTTGGVTPDNRALDINPADIASITVLKGPAATALYGIQAASGAIIITTKKGGATPGRTGPVVSFNSSLTFDQVNKLPKMQDRWAQGADGVYMAPNSGLGGRRLSWGPDINTLSWDGNANEWDPNGNIVDRSDPSARRPVTPYDPTDFFQTGTSVNNDVAFTGGNEKAGYRMSIGNVHQTGVIPKTKYDKTTLNLSGQAALSTKLSASASLNFVKSFSNKAQQGSNVSGVMLGLLRTPPTFDNSYGLENAEDDERAYVLPDGSQRNYRGGVGYDNPYWTINRNPYRQDVDRFFGSTQLDYKLLNWMTLTYRLGGDVYSQATKMVFDINSNAFPSGAIYNVDFFNRQFNSDFLVNMRGRLNDLFGGSLIVGHNYFTLNSSNRFAQGNGFSLPKFFDMSNATSFLSSEATLRKRTMAFYTEAQLDYRAQLYLTLTGRQETTSTLAPDKNRFFYPSASVGWVFTEALGLTNNATLPYGKLRVSFAQVGKDAPAQGLQTYYTPSRVNDGFTTGIFFPFGGIAGYSTASSISVIGNPELKPEKTNSFELGTDLTFFQGKVSFNATWYSQKTVDQIFTVPISFATGWASALLNAGSITNRGLELTLSASPMKSTTGRFQWDITVNWSRNVSKVNELYPGVDNLFIAGFENSGIYAVKGQPYGVIYGSRFERVNPDDPNSPLLINDNPADPGYGMPIPGTTNNIIGNINPDWISSIVNNFSFRGFVLGFQIDIRQGGDIWNGTRGAMSYFGTSEETESRGESRVFEGQLGHIDANGNVVHYAPDNVTELPGAGSNNGQAVQLGQYYWQNVGNSFIGPAEPSVEDGSFVRVRQVSLGYQFPKSWINRAKINSLALTVFANNPILWTDYTGVDPETSLAGPANGQGLDYFNNPGIKSYGARLNVTF